MTARRPDCIRSLERVDDLGSFTVRTILSGTLTVADGPIMIQNNSGLPKDQPASVLV